MMEQLTNVIYADTFLKRLKGLKKAVKGTMLILPNCRAIHTFGMTHPLKVIFLDRKGRVLRKISNLQPWRIAIGPARTETIIEII